MTELFGDLHFLRPLWLAALPLALLLWELHRRRQRVAAQWRGLIAPHLLAHLVVRPPQRIAFSPRDWLLALSLVASILLAGPSWQREPAPFAEGGDRLVIVLDLAPSMLATDLAPSRLVRARLKLRDLLALRRDSRVALVVFNQSAHVALPFTDDVSAIERLLDVLDPRLMPAAPADGQRVASALALADTLRQREGSDVAASVLLVSDRVPGVDTVSGSMAPVLWQIAPAATSSGAAHIPLSLDGSDVHTVHAALGRQLRAAKNEQAESQRWRDGGIWLLPLLVLLALPGARRGWSLRG